MKDTQLSENIKEKLINELHFQATRSSGKGGQNVNKVSSKIILSFNIPDSVVLNDEQKFILKSSYPNRITNSGILHISSSKERSQYMNKKNAIDKFLKLLEQAFLPQEERIATKPTKSSIENRLKVKAKKSGIKQTRNFKANLEE
jgi:ribosome-associated protein